MLGLVVDGDLELLLSSSSSRSSSATGRASSSAVSLGWLGYRRGPLGLCCHAERVNAQGHSTDCENVAGLRACLPSTRLPLTNVPLELPRSRSTSLSPSVINLAVASAHLGGADPDQAIVVTADAVDAVDQLERVGFAAAPDDLENIVHDLGNPGWVLVEAHVVTSATERKGYDGTLISSYPLGARQASGSSPRIPTGRIGQDVMVAGRATRVRHGQFPRKASCNPGWRRYTGNVVDAPRPSGRDGRVDRCMRFAGVAQG